MCQFVLVFFSLFSIAITSLGEERANLSAFHTFVLVWICRFPLPLGVWEGLRFVIVALHGLFSLPFFAHASNYFDGALPVKGINCYRYTTFFLKIGSLISERIFIKYISEHTTIRIVEKPQSGSTALQRHQKKVI